MLNKLLQFEWQFHARQVYFFVFFVLFLGYGVLSITAAFQFLEISTMFNDAFNLSFLSGIISLGSIFPIVFFCINAIHRDHTFQAEEMIFSTGITKFNFVISRFFGVFFMALLISSVSLFGVFIGSLIADLDPDKLHHFDFIHYAWPWLTIMLPNIFIATSIIFSITLLSQNAISVYIAGLFILVINWVSGYYINSPLVGGSSLSSPEILNIASITDLLGLAAFFEQTQFLTPVEKNNYLLFLSGHFLWNRVIWVTLGSALLFGAYQFFSFRKMNRRAKSKVQLAEKLVGSTKYKPIATTNSYKAHILAFRHLIKYDLKFTLSSIPFLAIMTIWVAVLFVTFNNSINGIEIYGKRYPTTDLFLGLTMEIMPILGALLIVFYSGELVWKSRNHDFNEIIDATPARNIVFYTAKYVALVIIPLSLILAAILVGILFQFFNGYYDFKLGLYFSTFYYSGLQLALFAVFALLMQIIVPNKYAGMIISGFIILLFGPLSSSIGLEHPLFLFNKLPSMARAHSDFVGFGQYTSKFNWLALYWTAFAGVLVLLSCKYWKRGTSVNRKILFSTTWKKQEKIIAGILILLFASVGGYIYYNINVINEYVTTDEEYDFNENYERKYKKYDDLLVPQLVSVNTKVDMYPEENSYVVEAKNKIANKSAKPMYQIFVTAPVLLESLVIENAIPIFYDSQLNTYLFKLNSPLLPDHELQMTYNATIQSSGFDINNSISRNGSYIKSSHFSPYLGYVNDFEINYAYEREIRGLPIRVNSRVNDEHLQSNSKFNFDNATFETILSTSEDQVAFSSGELIEQWKSSERNYFHFKSTGEINNMVAYFSAKYKVEKVQHRGVDIELYYLPDHYRNVGEMIKVTKATIDYCMDNFGAYPHKYLRIGEMSAFGGSNGQAMPGVVSINENIFRKNVEDPASFNVVARVLVHEVAHQWWGFLLTPKRTEGFMVLGESFAKYSETVILEKLYGKKMVQQLSEYTVRRYFSGRSYSTEAEPPLYLTQHQQYIAYSKGAIVMAAIRELIGEKALNTALRNLILKYHHAPMATTLNFMEELYAVTPAEYHELIDDWTKRVITYDLGLYNATYKQLNNGKYEVTINITAQRFETNEEGKETKIAINEPIQIGVFSKVSGDNEKNDNLLNLRQHRINKHEMKIRVTVDQIPDYIKIDPYYTRLDRNMLDNTISVSLEN